MLFIRRVVDKYGCWGKSAYQGETRCIKISQEGWGKSDIGYLYCDIDSLVCEERVFLII